MNTLYFDVETYYDQNYSLRNMTTTEYVMDHRFEALGAAVALNDEPSRWVPARDLTAFCDSIDWDNTALVSHNAAFDGAVLSWRFKKRPALYIDTLSMSRALLAHKLRSLALKEVAQHLNLGAKGDTIHQMKGVRAHALEASPGFHAEVAQYANTDNELCRGIFKALKKQFPRDEYALVDMIIRMVCEPKFQLDEGLLAVHLQRVRHEKQALLDRLGFSDPAKLMSNELFAAELVSRGVDPPRKISLRTGAETWAFAKTDQGFKDLANHIDPDVQALVAARLGHKTTIEETRTEKFLRIAHKAGNWTARATWLPIPLRFSGAHTHRLSGSDGMNMQNLPRGGTMRKAMRAPKGYKVVAADLSQIEARIVCWLAGAEMLSVFARGEDPYVYQAQSIGAMTPDMVKGSPEFAQGRQLGKGLVLGCGFGIGGPKFQVTVSNPPYNLKLSLSEAQAAVNAYRSKNPEIPRLWSTLGNALESLALRPSMNGTPARSATRVEVVRGLVYEADGDTVQLRLPSGLYLKYHNLRVEAGQLWFEYNGQRQYIYGGKAAENLVQALARCVIMENALRVKRMTGHWPCLQVHDENVYIVRDEYVEEFMAKLEEGMTARPEWAPDLPVATEIKSGETYGDCK